MRRGPARIGLCTLALALVGCGGVRVEPHAVLPTPLVERLPVTIGVHYPAEFSGYVHKETRYGTEYEITLGPGHVVELDRLLAALFQNVVHVEDPGHPPRLQPPVRMVLVPRFEDYSFLTPRDMAGDYYTVTIRYRLDVYEPGGERVDGYVFTGYGRVQSAALTGSTPLLLATQRAMREAGAKLAVELPDEETVRTLLAGRPVAAPRPAQPAPHEVLGAFGAAPPAGAAPSPPRESPAPAVPAAGDEVPEPPPAEEPPEPAPPGS